MTEQEKEREDELRSILTSEISSLEVLVSRFQNVPEVGDIWDQQHADTNMRAQLALNEAIEGLKEYFDGHYFPEGKSE